MMVAIVFLSFFMLSAAFMMLSYRYIIAEKRDAMERNADYIATRSPAWKWVRTIILSSPLR